MARITWKDGKRYPYSDGFVGNRQLFAIRAGGSMGRQPVMWTPLSDHGDFIDKPERGETQELLKARAERLLEDFVVAAGATFPEEEV